MSKLDKDLIWDYIIDEGIATEDTLQIVTCINGYDAKTLNDVLEVVTGYSYEQLTTERFGVTITGLGDSHFDRFVFEAEGLEALQDAIVEVFGDDYSTVYDCTTPGEVAGYLDSTIAYDMLTVGTYTLTLNDEVVIPEPLLY